MFQIVEKVPGEFGAGAKAPADAYAIAEKCGFVAVLVTRHAAKNALERLLFRLLWVFHALWRVCCMPSESVVFIQYPVHYLRSKLGVMFLEWLKRFRRVKFIVLIHDINRLRGFGSSAEDGHLERILGISAVVIAHNERMMAWMRKHGVPDARLVNLELFDYLTSMREKSDGSDDFRRMTLAGNLGLWGKSPFVRKLREIRDVEWELYGAGFDAEKAGGANVHFNGCFSSDEVVGHLSKGFGLVWDGDSVDTCSGGWGEYLRWNNPHKMSMYLAAGLPVVIWRHAAQAAFVAKHKVGFAVDSLRELGARLRSMPQEEYDQYKMNARRMAIRVCAGEFLSGALEEAARRCCLGGENR